MIPRWLDLYIHDIRNAQLVLGDTLLYPKFKEGEEWKELNEVNKKIETYLTELEYE